MQSTFVHLSQRSGTGADRPSAPAEQPDMRPPLIINWIKRLFRSPITWRPRCGLPLIRSACSAPSSSGVSCTRVLIHPVQVHVRRRPVNPCLPQNPTPYVMFSTPPCEPHWATWPDAAASVWAVRRSRPILATLVRRSHGHGRPWGSLALISCHDLPVASISRVGLLPDETFLLAAGGRLGRSSVWSRCPYSVDRGMPNRSAICRPIVSGCRRAVGRAAVRSPGHRQRAQAVHHAEDPEVGLLVRVGQG